MGILCKDSDTASYRPFFLEPLGAVADAGHRISENENLNLTFVHPVSIHINMDGNMRNILSDCAGFDWDKGNSKKNWIKHKVTPAECEQIFFNQPLMIKDVHQYFETEKRFLVLGKTDKNRSLFIAFTLRNNLIRVISARDMSRKEREVYGRL